MSDSHDFKDISPTPSISSSTEGHTASTNTPISTIYDVIKWINEHCRNTVEKGSWWERACLFYLRHDPEMKETLGESYLWKDAPTNNGRDIGIDIVAEDLRNPGKYVAIQCKNFDKNKLVYEDLATFFAIAQADERYSRYIIMSTCEELSDNLGTVVKEAQTSHLTPFRMNTSNVNWSAFISGEKPRPITHDLRPHQEEGVQKIIETFNNNDRCKAIMACGTGKTLLSLRLSERMANLSAQKDPSLQNRPFYVLFAAPSIALVSQAMRSWTNQARTDLKTIVVCSDIKAAKISNKNDDLIEEVYDFAFPATTDPLEVGKQFNEIEKQLEDEIKSQSRSLSPRPIIAVFSTYQSMGVIEEAQKAHKLPSFDLIVCDEAHRTTGIELSKEDASTFAIVLDGQRINGEKRLFMTATPRIYGAGAEKKQKQKEQVRQKYGDASIINSMDDKKIYGPEAYRITFADAVEKGLLCDYRVIVLGVSQDAMTQELQDQLMNMNSELPLDDAAKIIGCYKGLVEHGHSIENSADSMNRKTPDFVQIQEVKKEPYLQTETILEENTCENLDDRIKPLHRAVGFCRTINDSQRIDDIFTRVIEAYHESLSQSSETSETPSEPLLTCKLEHVDGSMPSDKRNEKLEWLAYGDDPFGEKQPSNDSKEECRILTNARCLSEGVDVPSLDAVIFFSPRKSRVDIIQAVGRVMRTFTHPATGEKKKYGYIILPVFIPAGLDSAVALDQNKAFDVVWEVVQALRSHDGRMEAYIETLALASKDKEMTSQAAVGLGIPGGSAEALDANVGIGVSGSESQGIQQELNLSTTDKLRRFIYSRVVKNCGSRIYWEDWADDIASIAQRHIDHIKENVEKEELKPAFNSFLESLRHSLNPSITEDDAINMVAQHMITLPVFQALFSDYDFASSNPVSQAINVFKENFEKVAGQFEQDDPHLKELYASVQRRSAIAGDNDKARQRLIKELYENFFSQAFKKTSEKLGIVYTPQEIISFILRSTDDMLFKEFGEHLYDKGVHILDPFAGTGSFMQQLISDEELMPLEHLENKYLHELHSNEILLLAYYIMVINIEYAYHARMKGNYVEYPGAVLTDTFQMSEKAETLDNEIFAKNAQRVEKENELDIRVIIGNPPYSAGQKNANDNNANTHYEKLEERIRQTYSAPAHVTNKNSLMDSYIEAFRWASDRIKEQGIVCFVSNGGWLRSQAGVGVRQCFEKEFSSIYVFDLRGNIRKFNKEEGGNVFGQGSMVPITITMLIKNPRSSEHGVIHYCDIGDYLSREEKLKKISESTIGNIPWKIINPDKYDDWLDQRDDSFYDFAPMGIQDGGKKTALGVFDIWSSGIKTQKDPWAWNFSEEIVAQNISRLIANHNAEIERCEGDVSLRYIDPKKYSWTRKQCDFLEKRKILDSFDKRFTISGAYRPFICEWVYYNRTVVEMMYQQNKLFPLKASHQCFDNKVITLSQADVLITNKLPDLHFVGDSQCFPLYCYEKIEDSQLLPTEGTVVKDAWGNEYIRRDAITDSALQVFRDAYRGQALHMEKIRKGLEEITKEDIFHYIYGILHSPVYRQKFATTLDKELPRIPLVKSFAEFTRAGYQLADLHLHYEEQDIYPNLSYRYKDTSMDSTSVLKEGAFSDISPVMKMKWGKKKEVEEDTGKIKSVDDYSRLIVNSDLTIENIPESAQDFVVNRKSALNWIVDRYQIKTDKATEIENNPNLYNHEPGKGSDPSYIPLLIGRVVTVSMCTNEIVSSLPTSLEEVARPASWPAAWSEAT